MTKTLYNDVAGPETVDRLLDASDTVRLEYRTGDTAYPLGSGATAATQHERIAEATGHATYELTVTADSGTADYEAAIDVDIDTDGLDELLDDLSDATGVDVKGVIGALDDLVGTLPIDVDTDGTFVYEGELPATTARDLLSR